MVRIANITGVDTCVAPLTAASILDKPLSFQIKMFSPTIIASSTTIPRTKMNTNRESILMETSALGRSQNPPIKEMGIPKETQKASFGFRKMAKTITTRVKPR